MALRLFQIFFGTSPRTRENGVVFTRGDRELGTSPRMRGKLNHRGLIATPVRNIPAHAGKHAVNFTPEAQGRNIPAHAGKTLGVYPGVPNASGTSPRTRGKPAYTVAPIPSLGNIPAHAGKTWSMLPLAPTSGEHPRVRGENYRAFTIVRYQSGTSPRVRGKPYLLAARR